MSQKTSSDEQNRLHTLHGYRIVDTEPEQIFDDLVGLAAAVCGTPMAVISFIDEQRQWFKASRGLGVSETPRNIAFCSHMIEACAPMVVKDARDDPRFSRNPLVTDEPNIRFYAGVPLVAEDGTCLGSVAVLDNQAASLDDSRLKALQSIAGLVMRQLQHRLVRLDLEESVREQRALMTALSRRERELGRSQQLLEIAGRVARLGGWQVDLERRRVSWSDEVAAIHEEPPGFSPELDAAFGYYAPEYRERIQQAFEACARDGRPFDEELEILTAGGRRIWVRAIGEPVQGSDGSVIAVQGGFQDISDRKQVERALQLSEERYRHAAEASQAALWDYDMLADRVEFSEAFREMLGFESMEDMPKTVEEYMELMHPDDRERAREAADRLIAGETRDRASAEFRLRTRSGEYRWFRSSSKVIRNADGRAVRRLGSTVDIHDRKIAEERTRKLAERLFSTLESISDAFLTVDREWQVTFLNRKAEALLQRGRDELLGKNIWEAFPESVETDFYRRGHEAMIERKTVRYEEHYPAPLDAWFAVTAYPTADGLAIYFTDETGRHRARQEAEESAERMRGVLESASEAIITVDEAGVIESVNPATCRLFDYEVDELIGQNISVLMPQDHAAQHDDYVRRYVKTGRARILGVPQKLSARRKDGSEFPIELTVTEVVLTASRVFTGFIQDITRNEQALEVLRTSEERFRAVARATTDVVWDYDLVANQVWWSDGLEAAFGHSVAEAGQSLDWWLERVHPDDREQVAQSLEEAIDRKQPEWSVRYRFRRKDGEFAYVVDSGFLILDEYGEPRRMVGGIKDITESRAARQKLSEQAELLDQARDAIIVRDLEHRVRYWNRGAERVYGWSAEEALGRSVSELLGPDPQRYQAAFREVLSEGRYDGQWRHRRKDGSEITVRSHWVLVTDESGRPRSVMAINTDISDQLELEEQLRQSQRLESIGQLTGGVAHDFNNLLTVILGNAELLTQQLESSPRLRHLAEMTQAAAQRGAELTNRLLAFARRQALEPESTDIAGLVDGMKPLLRRSISENIEIRIRHAENLWRAEIDPARLESALLNLALNARDAMAEGGRLLIETSNIELDKDYAEFQAEILPGDYVQVAVTDSGDGIPREHMERLFEPFFTTKEQGKGTGLGLAMVYGFVKQSSGHIKVYSETGEGTTVRMYLPRSRRTGERPVRATEVETELRGSERILVVEDDELVREHAERLLRHFGYEVEGAASGDEAMELLERRPDFDLLFTDVIMPGALNGPALAQAALSRKPDLKVLFTSGYTEDAIVHQGRLEEGVLLLQKPYRRLDLARKVREALDGA